MPVQFNSMLTQAGFAPADVRLLRHQDQRAERGRTPYELWRDDRPKFDVYQSRQNPARQATLRAKHWASFVGTPAGETLFVGLYAVRYLGLLRTDQPAPQRAGVDAAGSCDEYALARIPALDEFVGKLYIDWGAGARSWIQYADRHDKPIVELKRKFEEPAFPGFMEFVQPLSKVEGLPPGWVDALRACRGVYLLTCPRTKEQYVGSATGEGGFWQRWQEYVQTGHGGNVGLRSRDPSDYQVSILEVAGTAGTLEDILRMEGRWQAKLQSREMGLNRNAAGA